MVRELRPFTKYEFTVRVQLPNGAASAESLSEQQWTQELLVPAAPKLACAPVAVARVSQPLPGAQPAFGSDQVLLVLTFCLNIFLGFSQANEKL